MFSRIVVGVDGAQGGTDALALARRLASLTSEIVAVSIGVPDDHPTRGANLDYDRTVREDASARLAELPRREPEITGQTLIAATVAAGLHAAVTDVDADLIVIGSCRRGPIGQILAGDDARATLQGARCPVAIAPRDYALRDTPITTIGLGWNGGPDGENALEIAQGLADDLHGHVHAVTVTGAEATATYTGRTPAPGDADAPPSAPEGVEVTTVRGVPVDELERFAAEVDVMVVGSHQRGPLGRFTLGSASERLTQRCVRPLIVVPRTVQTATSPA